MNASTLFFNWQLKRQYNKSMRQTAAFREKKTRYLSVLHRNYATRNRIDKLTKHH